MWPHARGRSGIRRLYRSHLTIVLAEADPQPRRLRPWLRAQLLLQGHTTAMVEAAEAAKGAAGVGGRITRLLADGEVSPARLARRRLLSASGGAGPREAPGAGALLRSATAAPIAARPRPQPLGAPSPRSGWLRPRVAKARLSPLEQWELYLEAKGRREKADVAAGQREQLRGAANAALDAFARRAAGSGGRSAAGAAAVSSAEASLRRAAGAAGIEVRKGA